MSTQQEHTSLVAIQQQQCAAQQVSLLIFGELTHVLSYFLLGVLQCCCKEGVGC
jgi:hypothetical protein